MNNMRTEYWKGHPIRFVKLGDHWWAVLKDICDTLQLKTFKVSQRLDPSMLEKVRVDVCDIPSKYITSKTRKTQDMLVVNQRGIYQALFASRKLEARKFQIWTWDVLDKLRGNVGLEEYEVMQMVEPEIQARINDILDTLFWDDEKKIVMRSVTVQGGDVEQVPFE